MGTISAQVTASGTYYVYRESFRVKIDPQDTGKGKGSGKSKVRTRSIYLGTAEKILKSVEQTKEPLEVDTRRFGLLGAAYQTAAEIRLPRFSRNTSAVNERAYRTGNIFSYPLSTAQITLPVRTR